MEHKTIPAVYAKDREKNEERHGIFGNTCFCCGRPTAEKQFVHLLTSGDVINTTEEVENSQGFFPIGPECAKKYPKEFVFEDPGLFDASK